MPSSTTAEFSSEKCMLRTGRPLNSTFLSNMVTRSECKDLANSPPHRQARTTSYVAGDDTLSKFCWWGHVAKNQIKIIGAMLGLCGSGRLRIKNMCKWMSLSWIVEFHTLTTKVSVTWLGVPNISSTSNAGPCFVHVLSRTCKFEIVHIDYQHAIVLSMIDDTLPNVRENLFPTFFSDSAVQMVFPNTTAIGVPIQS